MNNLKHYLTEVEEIFNHEEFIAEPRELYEPIGSAANASAPPCC